MYLNNYIAVISGTKTKMLNYFSYDTGSTKCAILLVLANKLTKHIKFNVDTKIIK